MNDDLATEEKELLLAAIDAKAVNTGKLFHIKTDQMEWIRAGDKDFEVAPQTHIKALGTLISKNLVNHESETLYLLTDLRRKVAEKLGNLPLISK